MPHVTIIRALIVVVLAFAAGAAAGWLVNGWRLGADIADMQAEWSESRMASAEDARIKERVIVDAFAIIDAEQTAERTKAHEEITALRARVDAGAVRLRVAATCPAAGLPEAAPGAGLDHGTRAELAPDSRPDYFALRSGLTRLEKKLAACRGLLAAERASGL